MRLLLLSGLYSSLLSLALGLQCYHFEGLPDRAPDDQVAKTCGSTHQCCSSSLVSYNGLVNGNFLRKGCSTGQMCNQTQTGLHHPQELDSSETVLCCNTNLCNKDLVPDLGDNYRTECLACHGTPESCGGSDLPNLRCGPSQKTCIEVSITIALGPHTQRVMMKSCSNSSSCPGLAAFSNGQQPVSYSSFYRCCNGSQCNRGQFTDKEPGAENGLECYSYSSAKGARKTLQCRGQMTRCMDLIGSSPDQVVMSGCATEAFCQGLYPQFSIPGWTRTTCCSQSLCNHNRNSTAAHDIKH
ncbi:urokinase plasminogen activator surface receptor [Gastrophryne carolinensis]